MEELTKKTLERKWQDYKYYCDKMRNADEAVKLAIECKSCHEHLFSGIDVALSMWGDTNLNIYSVSHLKEVVPVLKFFTERGYKFDDVCDFKNQNIRTYTLHFQEGYFPEIEINVSFAKDAACKYVKIGTKQKDEFELQCTNGESVNIEEEILK